MVAMGAKNNTTRAAMAKSRPVVLFFSISDFGYVNVVLATIYELLRDNQVDVYLASFSPVKPRIDSLIDQLRKEDPTRSIPSVQFHNIEAFPRFTEWAEENKRRKKADVPHPSGRHGANKVMQLTLRALTFMSSEQYLSLYDWSSDLASQIDPELVVIDPILLPVHDMVRKEKRKYAVIHPWNVADGLIPLQPWLSAYWKYPAFSTGFRYPVPLNQIAENVYCYLNAKKCRAHAEVKAINAARQSRGIEDALGSFTPWVKDVPQITPSLPIIDLPMRIPSNVVDCGPILVPSPPLKTSDPELFEWLEKRPTILIALGTHFEAYGETIKQQAIGVRKLLQVRSDIQVLWKLKVESSSEKEAKDYLSDILGDFIWKGLVRIEKWLKADPVAILSSGFIACAVHHGGANSYYEALWAGVPQVVLSMWYDTFDYATRVEYLGVGVYGNRKIGHQPVKNITTHGPPNFVDGQEFGSALLTVVGRSKADETAFGHTARKLGESCRLSGGRVKSAKVITQLCFSAY